VVNDDLVPPEWIMIPAIFLILGWGFSKRVGTELPQVEPEKSEVSK
jgi:hypothetical protein